MECPKCNTPNLPSVPRCTNCGHPFVCDANKFLVDTETYYPPRYKDRPKRQMEKIKSNCILSYDFIKNQIADQHSILNHVVAVICSIIVPGAGVFYLNHKRKGIFINLGFLLCFLIGISLYRHPVSNLLFIAALLIWYIGIFYTIWLIRHSSNRKAYRQLKHIAGTAFLSIGFIMMFISALSITPFLNLNFPFMNYNVFPPLFLQNDRLLINNLSKNDQKSLERGDWVIIDITDEAQSITVIVGLPGDKVTLKEKILTINNQQIDTLQERIPSIDKEFVVNVPDGVYLIYRMTQQGYNYYAYGIGNMIFNPITRFNDDNIVQHTEPSLYRFDQIKSIIHATIFPANRRCLW